MGNYELAWNASISKVQLSWWLTHNSQIVNTLRHRVIAIENGRVVRDEAKGEYGYDD